jgi:hypothetical protein
MNHDISDSDTNVLIDKTYGAMRIRTADPLNAIEVLYQLSYNPLRCFIIMA